MSLKDLYEAKKNLEQITSYDVSLTKKLLDIHIRHREKVVEKFEEFLRNCLCPAWGYGGSIMCTGCNHKDLCDYIDYLLKDEE